jgi:hypothetical protein
LGTRSKGSIISRMKPIRTQITIEFRWSFGIDYKELFVTGEICNMANYPVIAWTRTFDPAQIIHRKLKLTFEGIR